MAQVSGNRRTKLEEPAPYALVGNIQTPLRKKILHIPIAQSEPGIEPNGASNDFRWKAVTFEGDGVHPKRLHRNHQIEIRELNVTMPKRFCFFHFLPPAAFSCIENLDPSVPSFPTEKGRLPFEFSRYRGFAGDAFTPVRNGTSIDAKHLSGGLVEDGTVCLELADRV